MIRKMPVRAVRSLAPTSKAAPNLMLTRIQSVLKKNNIVSMTDTAGSVGPVTGWIKTGIWVLDYLCGNFRGIPMGRGLVVWGPESVGKTSFCHFLMLCIQRLKGQSLYFDYDDAMDVDQMARSGVDLTRVTIPDVRTLEEGFDVMTEVIGEVYGSPLRAKKSKKKKEFVGSKNPMLVLWDSIQAAAPEALAMSDDATDKFVAVEARAYSPQLKRLRLFQRGNPILAVFTGEIRDKVGGQPGWGGPQHHLSGGKCWKFYPTTILKFSGKKLEKVTRHGQDVVKGMWVFVSAEKARKARMGRKGRFFVSFSEKDGGPNPAASNYGFLADLDMLLARGKEGVTIRGMEKEVGTFKKSEWPNVMAKHERSILAVLKERLLSDTPEQDLGMDDDASDLDDL